ncbi:MAG TPA: glycosyltransferase family 9 protein [Glaciihabitans sp.]|jgi:ADP-heptose:LPS heptosyltransferase|nr:glycosyltransferase family 9 protein [Glaciihabitans sp.]
MNPKAAPRGPELLVLRALKLGDLLVAVPAIHGLRRGYPDHQLVLAIPGWLEPIAALVPGVDALLPTPGLNNPLPLEPGRIDIAVNMHGRGPESDGIISALQARMTIMHAAPGPRWCDGILERDRWVRLVAAYGVSADANEVHIAVPSLRPRIAAATVVHVGAFYGSRRWPAERFATVAKTLSRTGHDVVLTGSADERGRASDVADKAGLPESSILAGELALDEFAAVIAAARLVITSDTGAAHLASAYSVPSVVLFGPAPPEEWGPPAAGPHIVLTDSSKRRGDAFAAEPDPALLAVSVDDVLAAVSRLDTQ